MSKITLHRNTMPCMDATNYNAEFPDDTTVGDLIEFISNEWSNASGEIIVVGARSKNMNFTNGVVNGPVDDEFMNRRLISIHATQYYDQDHTTNFSIIVA